jgi:hypothetical protein
MAAQQQQAMPFWKSATGDILRGTIGGISVVLVGMCARDHELRIQHDRIVVV